MQRYIVLFLKVAVAVGALAWLVQRGSLSRSQITAGMLHWPILLGLALLLYAQLAIAAWRWSSLLAGSGSKLRFRDVVSLTMIGNLFTLVAPGGIGGDLVKAFYLTRPSTSKKTDIYATIILDRALGLYGLLLLCFFGMVFNARWLLQQPLLLALGLAVLGGLFSGLLALFLADVMARRFTGNVLGELALAFFAYRGKRSLLAGTLALSVLSHLVSCACMYIAGECVAMPQVPASLLLVIVPLGFLAIVLPISPAGIGVAQAAFGELYRAACPTAGAAGVNASMILQTVTILTALTGVIPYLAYRSPSDRAMLVQPELTGERQEISSTGRP